MIKDYFKKIFSVKNTGEEYEIGFANATERFSAFIIDFTIATLLTIFILFPMIKKEVDKAVNSYTSSEVDIKIGEDSGGESERLNKEKNAENDADLESKKITEENIINITNKSNEIVSNNVNANDFNKENDGTATKFVDNQKIEVRKTSRKPTEEEKQEIIKQTLLKNKAFVYLVLLIPIIYNISFLLSKKQATIGQQIIGLKIIRRNGNRITFFVALDRVLLFTFSKNILIAPLTIVLPILITKEKTTIYDIFSGTRVIKVRNKIVKNNESNNNNIS